ncbi:hypothetical protein B0H11DRAFT_1998375 [Mycena galericulata]|nr:hypothetical protein B0H11DRAFT_1998375 [Mycena galericulata]
MLLIGSVIAAGRRALFCFFRFISISGEVLSVYIHRIRTNSREFLTYSMAGLEPSLSLHHYCTILGPGCRARLLS